MNTIKVGMERVVPSVSNPLLAIFSDFTKKPKSPEQLIKKYEKNMVNIEKSMEKELLKIFRNVRIQSSVKSDRYSLPIKYQVKVSQLGDSYLNSAFNPEKLYREVVKTLLCDDVYKLRFYVFAEIEDGFPMGKVNFYVNYHY